MKKFSILMVAVCSAFALGACAPSKPETKATQAAPAPAAPSSDTIKIGVLHSLSGTMAISETTLKDAVLMLVDEQKKKGGILGKKIEAVVVDPASNWP